MFNNKNDKKRVFGRDSRRTRQHQNRIADNEPKNILSDPPRRISLLSLIHIFINGTQSNIGFGFAGIGILIFVIGFRIMQGEQDLEASGGTWQHTTATITDIKYDNGNYFYFCAYQIDNKDYATRATLGKDAGDKLDKHTQDTITLEYLSTRPEAAYIVGSRVSGFYGIFLGLGGLFGGVGLILLFVFTRKNIKTARLYQKGNISWGTLQSKQATNYTLNDSAVILYTFEFQAVDGKNYIATGKAPDYFGIGNEGQELVLYLADNPNYNIIYDAVEDAPYITEEGKLYVKHKLANWGVFLIFILCVVGTMFIPIIYF